MRDASSRLLPGRVGEITSKGGFNGGAEVIVKAGERRRFDPISVDTHVVHKLGNVRALPCENKLGGSVINAYDSFAQLCGLVNTSGNSVVQVRTRTERGAQGSGGVTALQNSGGSLDVLCVPPGELLPPAVWTDQPTSARDVHSARFPPGGAEGAKSGVHAAKQDMLFELLTKGYPVPQPCFPWFASQMSNPFKGEHDKILCAPPHAI